MSNIEYFSFLCVTVEAASECPWCRPWVFLGLGLGPKSLALALNKSPWKHHWLVVTDGEQSLIIECCWVSAEKLFNTITYQPLPSAIRHCFFGPLKKTWNLGKMNDTMWAIYTCIPKIQIGFGFTFLVVDHPGSPRQNPESCKTVAVVVVAGCSTPKNGCCQQSCQWFC